MPPEYNFDVGPTRVQPHLCRQGRHSSGQSATLRIRTTRRHRLCRPKPQHLFIGYKDVRHDEFWVRGHMPDYPHHARRHDLRGSRAALQLLHSHQWADGRRLHGLWRAGECPLSRPGLSRSTPGVGRQGHQSASPPDHLQCARLRGRISWSFMATSSAYLLREARGEGREARKKTAKRRAGGVSPLMHEGRGTRRTADAARLTVACRGIGNLSC